MTEQFGKNIGDKVLTYSVLRLAIVSAYSGNLKTMIRQLPEGHFTLNCKLVIGKSKATSSIKISI